MTRSQFLAATSVLSALIVFSVFAAEEPFRIRSVSTAQPGEVSVVVELPSKLTPKADDFDLIIDDKRIVAREVRGLVLNIMFLVDVSGSMKGSKKDSPLEDAKKALLSFLGKKRQQLQFELTSFADQDTQLSSSKNPQEHINKSIQSLGPEGTKTRLYQALYNALTKDHKDDLQTRRIIIVVSDGKDEGSEVKLLDKVIAESKASLVPIYTVFRGQIEQPYSDILNLLAKAAGGDFFSTKDAKELGSRLEQIYDLESRSFLVHFKYDKDPGKTADKAEIELRRAAGSPLKDSIREKIPSVAVPARIPVPPRQPAMGQILTWLLWFLLAGFLLGVAVFAWWRSQRKDETRAKPTEPEPVEPSVIPERRKPEPEPPTRIGHHFPVPESGHPTATLIGIGGPVEGQTFSVNREIFHIGASAENDLSIGEDEYVSSEHAYLRYERGSLFIFDRTSRNGTFVNDNQVTNTGYVLRPGDRIRVGMSTFEVATPAS
jgi:Mg-chelatase subunit ChlD